MMRRMVESWRTYQALASSVKGGMDSMGASRLAVRVQLVLRVDLVVSSAYIVVATCFNITFIANESCQRLSTFL